VYFENRGKGVALGMQRREEELMTTMELYKILPEGLRAEIIDSQIYMSPAPFMIHQRILNKINNKLFNFLEEMGHGEVVIAPMDVFFDEERTSVQPDLAVLLDSNPAVRENFGHIHGAPDLLVEVLSVGSHAYDLILKKELYERFGVKEYWVVEPMSKRVQVFQWVDGHYLLAGDQVGCIYSPLLKIDFKF
jgi:Uma2 family endonuclease